MIERGFKTERFRYNADSEKAGVQPDFFAFFKEGVGKTEQFCLVLLTGVIK